MRVIKRPIDEEKSAEIEGMRMQTRKRERERSKRGGLEHGTEERAIEERFAPEICGSHSVSSYTQIVSNDFN